MSWTPGISFGMRKSRLTATKLAVTPAGACPWGFARNTVPTSAPRWRIASANTGARVPRYS